MQTASTPNRRPILSLADLEAFDPPRGRDPEKVCRCPICQGAERAFHFNTQTGVFNCKRASCGISGKLSDFWQDRPKMNRQQRARNDLHAAFNLKPAHLASGAIQAPHDAATREKPATGEATSEPATAQTWQARWNGARPIVSTPQAGQYLARRGISQVTSEAAGARVLRLYSGGYPRDYVAFPFCDPDGVPVAFQARAIDSAPDGHRAYGPKSAGVFSTAPHVLSRDAVILCESPIDALSLAACGYPAIALGGTVWPAWMPRALAFKDVALAFDNDANGAGDLAAAKLAPELESFGATVRRVTPPREPDADKSDWNGLLMEYGAPALELILSALFGIAHTDGKKYSLSEALALLEPLASTPR